MRTTWLHDIIKMRFVEYGYLPNYPYHLISDEEMCDAFIRKTAVNESCYFDDEYPCLSETFVKYWDKLREDIQYHIDKFKSSRDPMRTLPDWIYSYMLGTTIGPESSQPDRHDFLVLLNCDNIDDALTETAAETCLETSILWLKKLPKDQLIHRAPTMFGEPHVLKALRIAQAERNISGR